MWERVSNISPRGKLMKWSLFLSLSLYLSISLSLSVYPHPPSIYSVSNWTDDHIYTQPPCCVTSGVCCVTQLIANLRNLPLSCLPFRDIVLSSTCSLRTAAWLHTLVTERQCSVYNKTVLLVFQLSLNLQLLIS